MMMHSMDGRTFSVARLGLAGLSACLLFARAAVGADYAMTDSTLDAGGGWVSNGATSCAFSWGPSQPTGAHQVGTHAERAGFLARWVMFAAADIDGDGLADELDNDDDGDGLDDRAEMAGTVFPNGVITDPTVSDSDGDGATDGQELRHLTNPTDASSLFCIEGVTFDDDLGWKIIEFSGRGNGQAYRVLRRATPDGPNLSTQTLNVAGGTAPWYNVSAATIDVVETNRCYYILQLVQ